MVWLFLVGLISSLSSNSLNVFQTCPSSQALESKTVKLLDLKTETSNHTSQTLKLVDFLTSRHWVSMKLRLLDFETVSSHSLEIVRPYDFDLWSLYCGHTVQCEMAGPWHCESVGLFMCKSTKQQDTVIRRMWNSGL